VPQHPVPRAKFPVVDIHGHPPALVNAQVIQTVLDAMNELNLQVMVQANGVSGDRLKQQLDDLQQEFVSEQTMIKIDRGANLVSVVPVLCWRRSEFIEAYDSGAKGPMAERSPIERAIVAFVTLEGGRTASNTLKEELRQHVAREIGALARPDDIRFADALPKTRSGKIMRRLLREIATSGSVAGDVTTLEDFSVLEKLREEE